MPRYIDADALISNLDKALLFARTNEEIADLKLCKEIVRSAPTVSPDEARGNGKWIDNGVRAWSCSYCGTPLNHIRQFASFEKNELPNYCPNCGAKMEATSDA